MSFLKDYYCWLQSALINLAIGYVWYGLEFVQFGTLQWDRQCDEVVFWLYYITIAWLIHNSKNKIN